MFKHIAFVVDNLAALTYAQCLAGQFEVVVHGMTPAAAQAAEAAGLCTADSLESALQEAEVVITNLAGPLEAEEAYLKGSQGILALAAAHTVAIDMSVVTPRIAKDIAQAALLKSIFAFDAPMSGNRLFVGADPLKVADLVPVIEALCEEVIWFGEAGKATAARICEQVAQAGALIGMTDALALATQEELNLDQMVHVLKTGIAPKTLEQFAQVAVDGDYKGVTTALEARRDVGIALARSEELELTLPATETAFTLFDMLCQIGGTTLAPQALQVLYQDEAAAAAAGLDWSDLDSESLGFETDTCSDPECCCGGHHHDHHDHHGCDCEDHAHHDCGHTHHHEHCSCDHEGQGE